MAENTQNPTSTINLFNKGMVKDYNETFVGEGLWTHARNAVNNSHDGQIGVIGNEPSNLHCVTLPYTMIGCIHLTDDMWAIFTTDDIDSEIGIFDESQCTYTKKVNDKCLNFKRSNLITGASRRRYDCERPVYWSDGLNPDRFMDLDNPPFKYTETISNGCVTRVYTNELDCEEIRLASFIKHPCIVLEKGKASGTLPNGSYQIVIAYTINKVKVTDYLGLSEVQSLFSHENVSSSLEVKITAIDEDFEEFELVMLAQINGQTIARRVGYYSTKQGTIYLDAFSNDFETVPISQIVVRTEPIEKSDAIYTVNNYMLRVGTYSKTKFNYQPQANNIEAKWVAVEYPSNYYVKGGNNTGYMRDEQYAFFIRWIYNTGEFSESYHIPGRPSTSSDTALANGTDAFETIDGIQVKKWQTSNTATVETITPSVLADGGRVIGKGKMGYWESTELYPSNRVDIWGNLCGQPIRHHKFPDVTITGGDVVNHFTNDGNNIVILGVEFHNITKPLDINGNVITSIVGYEVLRGSREGHKTIISKGLINNMREYSIPNQTNVTGLYQNYPFNDLRQDSYLTPDEQRGDNGGPNATSSKLSRYKKDVLSFHGPDVTFSTPFLNSNEVKIYQELYGEASGRFETPYKHPKFKLPTDFTDLITNVLAAITQISKVVGAVAGADATLNLQADGDLNVTQSLLTPHRAEAVSGAFIGVSSGYLGTTGAPGTDQAASAKRSLVANTAITAANIIVLGAMSVIMIDVTSEQLMKLVLAVIPYKQYAAQYVSHGYYNKSKVTPEGNRRRKLIESSYVKSDVQSFFADSQNYMINNLNRGKFVIIKTHAGISDPSIEDRSRYLISERNANLYATYQTPISGHYGALKIPLPSQYGQLDSLKQLPISLCIENTSTSTATKFTSNVYFNGDVYINRFTEKNSMLFFNNWLYGEPNGAELDYSLYFSMPYPRFWVNNTVLSGGLFKLASKFRVLDHRVSSGFHVSRGYFYLFNSGVRDFFVESEVNVAYRDWEDRMDKRHYDNNGITDLSNLFRSDIIKEPNYYKYDYSLSVSKLFNSQITWGNMLSRDFDPSKALTCYSYYPNRVVYSLPQQDESKKDNWRVYLANNYKTFGSRVTSIKSINKTGALFMMAYQSPMQFMGVEELKLETTGAKITIGDGALFSGPQQLQALVNADDSYEYGSCQNKFANLGCNHGVFWVSQNQGKVFQYAGQLKEISREGMKWWFAKYLPSELLAKYPTYPYYDNPVKGVGVQMIYDNTNEIIYISKKDYKPLFNDMAFDADGKFYRIVNEVKTYYEFTNPLAFEDASWTISYDPKSQTWLSFHDWNPTFTIPGKSHFMSVDTKSIWKHNVRCDSYANFYGKDYPFEVEFVSATGQQVNSVRNIEYLLEVYKTHNNCADKFHVLDQNFDQAIIFNSEQVSGLLELNLKPKNNPVAALSFPQIQANSIRILFSKEENKYRFNQFWDVTKDRGEFNSVNVPMFNTKANGYQYEINSQYINYSKAALERKKFRHNVNKVWLRKVKSGDLKMLFKISNQKLIQSHR
jgi:hypothetical protein